MLSYILATIVGLGSVAFYMAAFLFPEVYRKGDFIWSGVGFFYALVLWFCAGQIGGAVLLGQTASVALVGWLGWQTLKLRRETTPLAEQTSTAVLEEKGISPTAIGEKITTIFQPVIKADTGTAPSPVSEALADATEFVSDAVTEALETVTDFLETKTADDRVEPTPPLEDITDFPSTAIAQESSTASSPVLPEPEERVEVKPSSPATDLPKSTPIGTTQDDLDDLEDELDEVISAPAPIPPSPTPSLQPKSRTFGFLASSIDRLKGLIDKVKPKSKPPIGVKPPSNVAREEMINEEMTIASPESSPTVEVIISEAVETEESSPTVEVIISEAVETEEFSPTVEVIISEAVETEESSPTVEVIISEAVETEESSPTVEVIVSEAVETEESSPTVEVIVSEGMEVVISSEVETIEIEVPEENIPDSEIPPETEASDLDEETLRVDETLPASDKPKPKKKQR
jgi:Ycf66 protein N-terminus